MSATAKVRTAKKGDHHSDAPPMKDAEEVVRVPARSWSSATIEAESESERGSVLDGAIIRCSLRRDHLSRDAGTCDTLTIEVPGAGTEGDTDAVVCLRLERWDDEAFATLVDALIAMRVAARMRGAA
jgi:hypothetical protein